MLSSSQFKNRFIAGTLIGILAIFSMASVVQAAEFPEGGSVPAGVSIDDDVFLNADSITMEGTINGTLIAGGQTVMISGTVYGDALLMGETVIVEKSAIIDGNLVVAAANVIIKGKITGSLFGGSATMDIGDNAVVARNLYYGGFSLTTTGTSEIGKDLFAGVYQGLMSGVITRDLNIAAAAVELNGSVGRNAKINVGDEKNAADSTDWMEYSPSKKYFPEPVQPGIRISDSAQIGGKLTYISSNDQTTRLNSIATGGVVYQTPAPSDESWRSIQRNNSMPTVEQGRRWGVAASVWNTLSGLITLLVLGALTIWLARKPFEKAMEVGFANPGMAFVYGFLALAVGFLAIVLVPIIFILTGIVVGFLSLGGLVFFWFGVIGVALLLAGSIYLFIVFTFSKLVAAYAFGKWILAMVFKSPTTSVWLFLLVGVFAYIILRAIPVLGWLVALSATLYGTGVLWQTLTARKTTIV